MVLSGVGERLTFRSVLTAIQVKSQVLMSSKAAVNGWILSAVSVSKVNSHGCAPLVHMCRT